MRILQKQLFYVTLLDNISSCIMNSKFKVQISNDKPKLYYYEQYSMKFQLIFFKDNEIFLRVNLAQDEANKNSKHKINPS